MDFGLSEEQQMIQAMARQFAQEEIRPIARACDLEHRFPEQNARRMGELGLYGIRVPEEYGGAGQGMVTYSLVQEEIAWGCASHAVIHGATASLCIGPITAFGNEEQKQQYLPDLAAGKTLGCYGLTEPEAGSDAGSLRTTASKDGDDYVLNGQKVFISNGAVADVAVVFARTDPSKHDASGVSAFIVDTKSDGFSVGKNEDKLGLNASYTNQLFFEDLRVPKENLLGEEGKGFAVAMHTLDMGRIAIGAGATGVARAAFEDSLAYAQERKQFGKPIAANQAIQWKLADMDINIEAARNLYLKAATMADTGGRVSHAASRSKIFSSEMAMRATLEAVQIHGGNGYTKDYLVEKYMRDIKVFEIFEGTNEINRLVIARHLLA